MIWIKNDQDEYNVRWFHQPTHQSTLVQWIKGKKVENEFKGSTQCTVYKTDGKPITDKTFKLVGHAYCSPKDHFDKEKARKVSLTKALEPLNKETRKLIWDAYFSRKSLDVSE